MVRLPELTFIDLSVRGASGKKLFAFAESIRSNSTPEASGRDCRYQLRLPRSHHPPRTILRAAPVALVALPGKLSSTGEPPILLRASPERALTRAGCHDAAVTLMGKLSAQTL